MAQINAADWDIDPTVVDGTELAARLNRLVKSIQSSNSGATRPPGIAAGGIWAKIVGTDISVMLYDGTSDHAIGNLVGGAVSYYSAITQDATNNVGIGGTTTPDAKLTVTGTAYSKEITLVDAAAVDWDTSLGQVAKLSLGGNRTINAPTKHKAGAFYALAVLQTTGNNTLTWNTAFKWDSATAPTLSTAAGAHDYFVFRSDGTNLYEQGRSQGVA